MTPENIAEMEKDAMTAAIKKVAELLRSTAPAKGVIVD